MAFIYMPKTPRLDAGEPLCSEVEKEEQERLVRLLEAFREDDSLTARERQFIFGQGWGIRHYKAGRLVKRAWLERLRDLAEKVLGWRR